MSRVEIYKLQDNGEQKVVAVCQLEGNAVKCEGDEELIQNLIEEGINDYNSTNFSHRLYPTDGKAFLEQLKYHFTSGYINASEIIDDET